MKLIRVSSSFSNYEVAKTVRLLLLLLTFNLSAKKVEATPMRSFFKLVYLTIATVTCHNKGMYFGLINHRAATLTHT